MEYRQPFTGDYGISQGFGKTEWSANHTGIDFLCPAGTPILASEAGNVFFAGWKPGGYGYCVFLQHPDGMVTIYEHLLKDIPVAVGQAVQRGQVIGYSGSTGNSTGPHLHFEMRDASGQAVNPMRYLHSSIAPAVGVPDADARPLQGADTLGHDVEVVAPAGAFGWALDFNRRETVFPCGTKLHFTGRTTEHNGYTYCECYPEPAKYWVAVHDNDTQILANQE